MNDATYITHELADVHLMGVHKNKYITHELADVHLMGVHKIKYILVTCPFWVSDPGTDYQDA